MTGQGGQGGHVGQGDPANPADPTAGVPPATLRLFFALWPAAGLRAALHRETRARVRSCDGRPVAPENLHLTLAFLGNIAGEHLDALTASARTLSVPRFDLELDRYGWFEAAQVLWIGCREVPAALGGLARDLAQQAAALTGRPADTRAFHPHVTLARKVRNPPDLAPPRPLAWAVDGFVLAQSVTEARGVRYEVLATCPLSG